MVQRRTFLKSVVAAIIPFLFPRWLRARIPALAPDAVSAPEQAQLRELAAVVLPASLGRAGTDAVADQFAKWIRNYKPGADLGYGYGFTQPRVAPPSPAGGYPGQLAALEAAAKAKGNSFARLDRAGQREIVGAALEQAKISDVPRRPGGAHVAADLMSFFFYGPGGEDFLYNAAIHRDECRGLPDSPRRPARLR
ncbi:MAG TPA: hypothetical protein VGS20_10325 [Candidatus Acidoferrales bacterium]|nr:hypothetical protein [Candidatus Acidoferrales bacterium]